MGYELEKNVGFSTGIIQRIEGFEIFYNSSTNKGSSGSPIMNLKTHKIIGIHRAREVVTNMKIGIMIRNMIERFNKKFE